MFNPILTEIALTFHGKLFKKLKDFLKLNPQKLKRRNLEPSIKKEYHQYSLLLPR